MIIVQNQLITPSPTVVTIVIVDFLETSKYLLDILYGTLLYLINQTLFLALRQQQSTEVRPSALTYFRFRIAEEALFLSTLQDGTHVDTQCDIIVFQAFIQGRGIDNILVEVIGRHIITRCTTQSLQDLNTLNNLAYGERTQPVKVDDTLLRLLWTFVTLRPFLDITIQTYGGDISSWYQIHRLAVCNQIWEWQIARVWMVHQFTEADREGTYRSRHQDIRARGRLRTTLQRTVMQRSHLIGMVREVGIRTCVIERELSANQ